jgi:hypothetical protein
VCQSIQWIRRASFRISKLFESVSQFGSAFKIVLGVEFYPWNISPTYCRRLSTRLYNYAFLHCVVQILHHKPRKRYHTIQVLIYSILCSLLNLSLHGFLERSSHMSRERDFQWKEVEKALLVASSFQYAKWDQLRKSWPRLSSSPTIPSLFPPTKSKIWIPADRISCLLY